MKVHLIVALFVLLLSSCKDKPIPWDGPVLVQPRNHLTVTALLNGNAQPLLDMSYFAQPAWSGEANHSFSGTLSFEPSPLVYPKEKEHYAGENLFPKFDIGFIAHEGELIPLRKEKIFTRENGSFWDVMVGTGKVWQEKEDHSWSRASFPLTLTDRWVGTARNCVATFVYNTDSISPLYLQCSQETADIDDKGIADISGMLKVTYQPKQFEAADSLIAQHLESASGKLPVRPLSTIDKDNEVADFFEKMIYTNAPTSMGAILMDEVLYVHPPKTRHGIYPYPGEMRHGLYSVTKSMAGALSIMYLSERYEDDVFDKLIVDYVPALADHEGWQDVTFAHTLNMVTGNVGGESLEHFYGTVIVAETAEEAIHNVARLGDAPELPGQQFNYASANLLVLSYALQQYVEEQEGEYVNYWDLVHKNVLVPIGAEHFSTLHTLEKDQSQAIPLLGLGALPTIEEAAKIALLFANNGRYNDQQILDEAKVKEAMGRTEWAGYDTKNDYRGQFYRHSFWSKKIRTGGCDVEVTFMLGFGEHYIVILPGNVILFRFLDEHDMDIDDLIKRVEKLRSFCN